MPAASKPPTKVSLYSLPELKAATDEALAPYLTTLPAPYTLTQDHTLTNIRLALGYSAVLIAGVLFYVDWKFGWEVTKPYTLPSCVVYFLLNGAMTLWVMGVEAGTAFQGRRAGGQKLKLASHVSKPRPEYYLDVLYSSPNGDTKWQENMISIPFNRLFNTHGYLQKKELHKFLAREIEMIGLADPEAKQAMMEYEREAGGKKVEDGPSMSGALPIADGDDMIEVDVGNASGIDRRLEDVGSTPKRGPGRPKKKG